MVCPVGLGVLHTSTGHPTFRAWCPADMWGGPSRVRSRVVSINAPERSYHIFYQLCAGASPEQRRAYRSA